MKNSLLGVVSLLMVLGLIGCSSSSSSSSSSSNNTNQTLPVVTGSGNVTSSTGAKVVTTDGRLSATILSGSLVSDTTISITPLDTGDGYSLKPDGTQFSESVSIDLDIDSTTTTIRDQNSTTISLSGALVAPVPYVVSSDNSVEALQNVQVTRDLSATSIRLSGSLTHFSDLKTDLSNGVFVYSMDYDATQAVDAAFNATLNLQKFPSGTISSLIPVTGWSAGPLVWTTEGVLSVTTSPYTFDISNQGPVTQAFVCTGVGTGKMIAKLTATVDSSATTNPATIDMTLIATVDCKASVSTKPKVAEGTVDLTSLVGNLEAVNVSEKCSSLFQTLDPTTPRHYALVSMGTTSGQSSLLDLDSLSLVSGVSRIAPSTGTDCIANTSDTTSTGCVVSYGVTNGWARSCFYDDPTNGKNFGTPYVDQAGAPPPILNDLTTDSSSANVLGNVVRTTSSFRAQWLSDFDGFSWATITETSYSWLGYASVEGTKGGDSGSPALILGWAETNQGEIWYGDPTLASGTFVGYVGDNPGKMRCTSTLCVTTGNSLTGTISTVLWSDVNQPPKIVNAAIPVASYPYRAGLYELADGSVMVATVSDFYEVSVGVYANSYTIVKLDNEGKLISNNTYVLSSCTTPVDAQFINETQLAIACQGDKTVQVLTIGASAPAP